MQETESSGTLEAPAQSSIEITRSVKGEYGWHLKVYVRNDELFGLPERLKKLDLAMREEFAT